MSYNPGFDYYDEDYCEYCGELDCVCNLCPECGGDGRVYDETDYLRPDGLRSCPHCFGTGERPYN